MTIHSIYPMIYVNRMEVLYVNTEEIVKSIKNKEMKKVHLDAIEKQHNRLLELIEEGISESDLKLQLEMAYETYKIHYLGLQKIKSEE